MTARLWAREGIAGRFSRSHNRRKQESLWPVGMRVYPFSRESAMKTLKRAVQALALLVLFPVAASAQKLEAGKWTGVVTPPGEGTVNVTFDVAMKGDTIAITLNAAEHGSFVLEEVKLVEKKLTFQFSPGPLVKCALDRQPDGSFSGQCTDGSESPAQMVMTPPKKG